MSDPGPDDPHDDQAGFAEDMRQKSAGWFLIAEKMHPNRQDELDAIEDMGVSAHPLRQLYAEIRGKALFAHSMWSAQARAYDDLLAAGGPDDTDAYAAYRRATDFNLALMATPSDNDEGSNRHSSE